MFTTEDVSRILKSYEEGTFKPTDEYQAFAKSLADPLFNNPDFAKFTMEMVGVILKSVMQDDMARTITPFYLFVELGYKLKEAELAATKVPEVSIA